MPRADRASQFMPFAALKGYEDALKEKEVSDKSSDQPSEAALEYMEYQHNQELVEKSINLADE